MIYRILADLTLLLHLLFIVYAMLGGLLVLYRHWSIWLHIPVVIWASVVNLVGWVCPLTPLEIYFRRAAGGSGYEGGFMEHYIAPLIYPDIAPQQLALLAGTLVIVWNMLIYGFVTYRWRHQ
jgi:hypothetical protein